MHASEYAAVYEHGMSPVVVARRLVLHGHKDKTIGGFAGKVDAAKNGGAEVSRRISSLLEGTGSGGVDMEAVLKEDFGGCKASFIIENVGGHPDRFAGGEQQPMIMEDTAEFRVDNRTVPGFCLWDLPGYCFADGLYRGRALAGAGVWAGAKFMAQGSTCANVRMQHGGDTELHAGVHARKFIDEWLECKGGAVIAEDGTTASAFLEDRLRVRATAEESIRKGHGGKHGGVGTSAVYSGTAEGGNSEVGASAAASSDSAKQKKLRTAYHRGKSSTSRSQGSAARQKKRLRDPKCHL